jgi:hypothetical protein
VLVVNVACPPVNITGVAGPPSRLNDTLPVGVVPPLTVAVNVTLWPYTVGSGAAATVVVVAALMTTCMIEVEVLAVKLPSPE